MYWTFTIVCGMTHRHCHIIFTEQCYASTIYAVIVCLCITCQYFIETAKLRIMQTIPHNNTGYLRPPKLEFRTGLLPTGASNASEVG